MHPRRPRKVKLKREEVQDEGSEGVSVTRVYIRDYFENIRLER